MGHKYAGVGEMTDAVGDESHVSVLEIFVNIVIVIRNQF